MELKHGTTLQNGKYSIEKKLGNGSFGITYLASMQVQVAGSLGTIKSSVPVAVKEFFMSELNSRSSYSSLVEGSKNTLVTNYRRKFRTEAQNLGRLNHSGIVKVLEVWDENNTTYYSMEYIDGTSLDDYIGQHGPIPEAQALKMFRQLAEAVQYMHSKRMLHLDIKPKNAMVGKDGNLVLIDFGLSKQYDSNGDPESSTGVGCGTPGYAPIEQANYRDGRDFPVTMDVYALGATLFKMLTGVRPPEAWEILNDGFPIYKLQECGIGEVVSASVSKAMAPTKRDRYQTVDDFMDSFEDEAMVVDVEIPSRMGNVKVETTKPILETTKPILETTKPILETTKPVGYTVLPTTNKVVISYFPGFRSFIGLDYNVIIKRDKIQIFSGYEEATFDISGEEFSKFLTSLGSLGLDVRQKENPELMDSSEPAAKLTITLYDDSDSAYAKYWIGGWKNQFGNIIGDTHLLNEKVKPIIPHLDDFLNFCKR